MELEPFALITRDLILLPTPWAAEVVGYRTLFRKLHADPVFCRTAFGPEFDPLIWGDDEMRTFFMNRDVALRWQRRGMGDFAVGILPEDLDGRTAWERGLAESTTWHNGKEKYRAVTGLEYEALVKEFDHIDWAGYTCVRDAKSAETAINDEGKDPWQEMIEVRYGLDDKFRGKGLAIRSTDTVMHWATMEKGARRFIAETERDNVGSQKLLTKMGFIKSETRNFDGEGIEWTKQAEPAAFGWK